MPLESSRRMRLRSLCRERTTMVPPGVRDTFTGEGDWNDT